MKTIGILHNQVGGTDGVSLKIDKWKLLLEEMGHTVHLCAGDLEPQLRKREQRESITSVQAEDAL